MEDYMFLSKRISMLLLSISCCFASLQADFITLSVWERTTPSGEKQQLVLLGDKHDLIEKADEQSNDLINWLEQRNNPSDIVLIEDMGDFTYIIEQAKAYLKEHAKNWDESCLQDAQVRYDDEFRPFSWNPSGDSVLRKVGQKLANKKNIKSLNVEFRIHYIGQLSCLSPAWAKFLNDLTVFMMKKIYREILTYNYGDCRFLSEYYQNKFPPLFLFDNRIPDDDWCDFLLEAHLLHNIYRSQIQQTHSNVVVICAGAVHTREIENELSKLDYQRIDRDGAISAKEASEGTPLSRRLKYSLDKLSLHQQADLERQVKTKKRLKQISLGFDVDMGNNVQSPPATLQAKL